MSDDAHHEIVIIRRGHHGDHDDHHGGVWKIAFADFMTAMMAFFLVMWLISANDKTRASVARYFNPVRLVDATTQPRGLHDTKKDESGITASPDTKKAEEKGGKESKATGAPESPKDREKRLDGELRENPYAALAEIAAAKGPGDSASKVPPQPAPAIGRKGGEAFRDPFAPPQPLPAGTDLGSDADDAKSTSKSATVSASVTTETPKVAPPAKPAQAVEAAKQADVAKLQAAIDGAGRDGGKAAAGPKVDVRQTGEGLLVSLTDTSDFSMFASGSTVPARKVVTMMEKVAQVLKARPGTVVVRGFTDSKPYRSGRYDNWHLSLDRAQVTHYMLVRGGLADTRIGHVEGYADRGGRAGIDPSSPLNRRIEILVKDNAL